MENKQLIEFITSSLANGETKEKITKTLIASGWAENDVSENLKLVLATDSKTTPVNLDPVPVIVKTPARISKKKIIIIAAIVVGLMLISGGAYAFVNDYLFSPEKVMGKMMDTMSLTKTGEFTGDIKISYQVSEDMLENIAAYDSSIGSSSTSGQLVINFNGSYDNSDASTTKSTLSVAFSPDMIPDSTGKFSIDTRELGDMEYIKINLLPTIGVIDLTSLFKDKWIGFSFNSLSDQMGGSYESGAASSTESVTKQAEKLDAILKNKKIFNIISVLPVDKIDGEKYYHYKLAMNKEELKKGLQGVFENGDKDASSDSEQSYIDQLTDLGGQANIEVWINKKDYSLKKYSVSSDATNSIKEFNGLKELKIYITVYSKNLNQPIDIKAPEPYQKIEEFIGELMGGLGGSFQMSTSTATSTSDFDFPLPPMNPTESNGATSTYNVNVDSDNDELSNIEEEKYGTDSNKPDTDGDGYLDGVEVKGGFNPLGAGALKK